RWPGDSAAARPKAEPGGRSALMKWLPSAAIGLLTLGACTSPPPPPPPTIALSSCDWNGTPAECGTVRVFENRVTHRGRAIDLRVIVLRADRTPATSAVVMLAGGPGEGGSALVPLASGWARPLRSSLDLVFVDQRGTGQSHPLGCPSPALTDPAAAFG